MLDLVSFLLINLSLVAMLLGSALCSWIETRHESFFSITGVQDNSIISPGIWSLNFMLVMMYMFKVEITAI